MTIRHLYPAVEPSLNLDFANSKRLDPRITFSRFSIGTYTDESGIIRTAADNEARFDHDGDGNSLGLLIEESRTNLVTYSEDLTIAPWAWTNNSGTPASIVSNSSTAPDGAITATEIQFPSFTTGYITRAQNFNAANTSYVFSVWLKAKSAGDVGKTVNLQIYQTGTPTVYRSHILTNNWVRVSTSGKTLNAATAAVQIEHVANQGAVNVLAWGAQLEEAAFPTSYIPTDGTPGGILRAADVASMTGTNFSSWYNQSEGTIVASFPRQTYATGLAKRILSFANDDQSSMSAGNGIVLGSHTGGVTEQRWRIRGNTLVGFGISTGINSTALAYAVSDSAMVFDGGTVEVGAGATFPAPLDRLNLFPPSAPISRLTYYPVRLSDGTLQALTL
jgi:hypothetical protein